MCTPNLYQSDAPAANKTHTDDERDSRVVLCPLPTCRKPFKMPKRQPELEEHLQTHLQEVSEGVVEAGAAGVATHVANQIRYVAVFVAGRIGCLTARTTAFVLLSGRSCSRRLRNDASKIPNDAVAAFRLDLLW